MGTVMNARGGRKNSSAICRRIWLNKVQKFWRGSQKTPRFYYQIFSFLEGGRVNKNFSKGVRNPRPPRAHLCGRLLYIARYLDSSESFGEFVFTQWPFHQHNTIIYFLNKVHRFTVKSRSYVYTSSRVYILSYPHTTTSSQTIGKDARPVI